MKTLCIALIALFMTVSFTACKKEAEVDPDMGSRLAGRYALDQFEFGGKTYPIAETDFVGSMEVVRESATAVTLVLDVKNSKGARFLVGSTQGVMLTDAGGAEVQLTKDGNNLGRGNKNKLYIRGVDSVGDAFIIIGKK